NTAFCLLGYFAGPERERLQLLLERSGWVVLAIVVALFVGWRILRGRRVRHGRTPRATRQPGEAPLQAR
ncbi:MAG TPA: hypothetical protein VE258_01880, partial [Ktedonobacterales bacterium]|nr:hypothetical protein [Ktedonobacterales bacterium]